MTFDIGFKFNDKIMVDNYIIFMSSPDGSLNVST